MMQSIRNYSSSIIDSCRASRFTDAQIVEILAKMYDLALDNMRLLLIKQMEIDETKIKEQKIAGWTGEVPA
jgi:hypothetical protein